jgi:hypothetical protein
MSIARLGGQWGRNVAAPAAGPAGVAGPAGGAPAPDERFEALTKYIPTETITIFVATMSALLAIAKLKGAAGFDMTYWAWVAYIACALLTPILVWAIAFIAFRPKKAAQPDAVFKWPIFRMIAATIAFLVWALAVPGLLEDAIGQIFAGLGAVIVSTLLSIAAGVFE